MREQKALAWSQMSEAQHWAVVMPPSKTPSKAKEAMPMPLKSVAKGSAHSCEALRAGQMALPLPGTGLDAQACQGEWQATHLG